MLKFVFFSLVTSLVLVSCSNGDCCKNEAKAGESTTAPMNDGKHFGTAITSEGAIQVEDLAAKMNSVDSLDLKLAGVVNEVCQKKGCWMTLKNASGEEVRVTFKDYAFFMPKDISGKKVVLDGYAYTELTSVETLRHLAEDGGKSKEEIAKITAPKKELSYEAKGVVIVE